TAITQSMLFNGATTTTLASSANPSVWGQSVTITVTVASTFSLGTPTGTLTLTDGATTLATLTLSSGSATYTTATFSIANHPLNASYSGDPNFNSSNSTALTQTVNQATTASDILFPGPTVVGQPVTFTGIVTVNAPGAGTPTGTLTFVDQLTNTTMAVVP